MFLTKYVFYFILILNWMQFVASRMLLAPL